MTERDLLARAAGALREEHTGARVGSGLTRARIMKSLHERRRRRIQLWGAGIPLAALLLAGSAWAQATGQWPRVWHTVTTAFSVFAQHDAVAPAERAKLKSAKSARSSVPTPAPAPPTSATAEPEEPEAVPEPTPEEIEPPKRTVPKPRKAPIPAAPVEPAPSTEQEERGPDPELVAFREAHDAHYRGGNPSAALNAYQRYLATYPTGRFVPEAKYNIALNLVRLGRTAEARSKLQPFVDGAYGTYRQGAAQKLLESLQDE